MSTDYFMVCKKCMKTHNYISRQASGLSISSSHSTYDFTTDHLEHGITIENEHSQIVEDINLKEMSDRYKAKQSEKVELKFIEEKTFGHKPSGESNGAT